MTALNNEIFLVDELNSSDGSIRARLSINDNSTIFRGHFPTQPVVPGACMLQVIKDVMERTLAVSLILKKADHLKFTGMIVPGNNGLITLDISYKEIEDQEIKATAKISLDAAVCFKFQGIFLKNRTLRSL